MLAGWPQGPPGSESTWSGGGKTFVPGPTYQLPAVWGLELAGQQSSRQQDRRTGGLVSQQTGGLERPNTEDWTVASQPGGPSLEGPADLIYKMAHKR